MELYKKDYLEKYVQLAVRTGVNIQKGQNLIINASVECAYFVRMAVEEAYKAGAHDVFVRWNDDKCARSRFLLAPDDVFDEFPEWTKMMLDGLTERGAAVLSVSSADPEALKGVNLERITRATKSMNNALKDYKSRMMASHVQWCVVSVPSDAWARKVFPEIEDTEKAKEKLWDYIYNASRIDENDAVANWKEHVSTVEKNAKILNDYNFKKLHFTNSVGTDLELELPIGHIWGGAAEKAKNGVDFVPNMPTEEIFTAPKRDGINGKVVGSKPFVYSGNVVENFSFTFKDGKVVDYSAEKGKDVLEKAITSIENMDYLGEVALVPYDSPISKMNTLFYNTLYDENASCHLALGKAYPNCIKGGADMSVQERTKAGLNHSDGHHDFMIGTSDLSIIGITHDGKEIEVFKDGNFAF